MQCSIIKLTIVKHIIIHCNILHCSTVSYIVASIKQASSYSLTSWSATFWMHASCWQVQNVIINKITSKHLQKIHTRLFLSKIFAILWISHYPKVLLFMWQLLLILMKWNSEYLVSRIQQQNLLKCFLQWGSCDTFMQLWKIFDSIKHFIQ